MDSQLNLYTLNKGLIKQLKNPTEEEITQLRNCIAKWRFNNYKNNGYFMLLNKEIGYYTIFRWQNRNDEHFQDVVIECAEDLGKIKAWDIKDEAIELWVTRQIEEDEEALCLYLFPYDNGIVYFGG